MTLFELDYIIFENKPERHQLKNTFPLTIEEVFETLEIADVEMTTTRSSKIIEPIFNRNCFNTFYHHYGPNQHQHVHKHTGQHYQSRPFQRSKNLLPPYLKGKNFIWT